MSAIGPTFVQSRRQEAWGYWAYKSDFLARYKKNLSYDLGHCPSGLAPYVSLSEVAHRHLLVRMLARMGD
jgi:hypothetical protein